MTRRMPHNMRRRAGTVRCLSVALLAACGGGASTEKGCRYQGKLDSIVLGIDSAKEAFHACLLNDSADAKRVFPEHAQGTLVLQPWATRKRVS
jgi:hypothetical protein